MLMTGAGSLKGSHRLSQDPEGRLSVTSAPSTVDRIQLNELGIRLDIKK